MYNKERQEYEEYRNMEFERIENAKQQNLAALNAQFNTAEENYTKRLAPIMAARYDRDLLQYVNNNFERIMFENKISEQEARKIACDQYIWGM